MVLLALLLDLLESGVVLLTITTFVMFLSAVTLVAKVRTIGSLTFKSPIFQTIFLPLCWPPLEIVPIISTPSGNVSLTITPFATLGPTLTTVIVHKTVSLTKISVALTLFVICTSQTASSTVVLLLDVLLAVSLDETLTVLVILPRALVVNLTVKLVLKPGANLPSYMKVLPNWVHFLPLINVIESNSLES